MDNLLLDLATLEVERLDATVIGPSRSLELFGMGHASAELAHSCEGSNCDCTCASEAECDSSCDCDDCGE